MDPKKEKGRLEGFMRDSIARRRKTIMGLSKKCDSEYLAKLEKKGDYGGAGMVAESLGDNKRAIRNYIKAGDHIDVGLVVDQSGIGFKAFIEYMRKMDIYHAITIGLKGVVKNLFRKKESEEEGLEQKVAVIIGLGVLIGGLYYLFSDVSITGSIVINLTSISSGFLVSFILICVLGLLGYFYMKE